MSRAGFTLIEVTIAVVVLGVAVLGMASVLAGTSRWQDRSQSAMALTSAASGKLDELRDYADQKTADTLQLLPGGSLTADATNHADSIRTGEGVWVKRRWLVGDGPVPGTRTVVVRVSAAGDAAHRVSARDFTTMVLMAP